jgi:phenylacetate-CoA ligase
MGVLNKLRLLRQVRKNQWLKTSELEELQAKKLRAIVKHAYNNTEFYHRKFKDAGIRPEDIKRVGDLEKVPFTTKEELREHSTGSILAKGVDLNKCKVTPTSGSTGTPLKVVYDGAADDFSKAVNLRSMMENGLKIRVKWVNIGDSRTASKPSWFQKLGFFNLVTLNLFDSIEDEINTLININPDIIVGYPSQLNLIARYVEQQSIAEIKPRTIFTTAELLDNNTRKLINSVFNLELVDLFGCVEVNRTAWECPEHQGYHLDIDSVVTEFVKDGENVAAGERGNIVYTCLFNYAMPLIRYEVGDVGVPSGESCTCGRGLPMMKCVEGRADDFISLPSGKIISPIVLALVMKHSEGVVEYQLVQETFDKISAYLVVSEEFDEKHIEKLGEDIRSALNNEVSVKIKIQDALKRGSTGKIRSVISKVGINT